MSNLGETISKQYMLYFINIRIFRFDFSKMSVNNDYTIKLTKY